LLHQIDGAIETGAAFGMYTMDKCLDRLKKE
jgi:Tfp pilus assembly pilus retraction ATPase PilT